MLGLVAMRADIGVDKEYKSGMYFCRITEEVDLAAFKNKYNIHSYVKVGAIMLPLKKQMRSSECSIL